MGANNWGSCPRCAKRYAKAIADMNSELDTQYGKIPELEYRDKCIMRDNQVKLMNEDRFCLREDWEIGINDGKFSVSYSAGCYCGFQFSFKHEEAVE
jgi:hypothetical protein